MIDHRRCRMVDVFFNQSRSRRIGIGVGIGVRLVSLHVPWLCHLITHSTSISASASACRR